MEKQEVKVALHSRESEMMVLGCMLTDLHALEVGSDSLEKECFYMTEHRLIFEVLQSFRKEGKPADIHLVCEELKRKGKLKETGGPGYITTLAQFAGTSAYVEEYIDQLEKTFILRKMIFNCQDFENRALESKENINTLFDDLERDLTILNRRRNKKIPVLSVRDRLRFEDDFLKSHRGCRYLGLKVKTIDEFNENFLGLRELILLAAAPNVGKTALAVQLAIETLLTEEDCCLAFFSLEMPASTIFRRMILSLSKINFRRYVFGGGSFEE